MDFDKLVCVLASVLKGGNTCVLLLNFYMSSKNIFLKNSVTGNLWQSYGDRGYLI